MGPGLDRVSAWIVALAVSLITLAPAPTATALAADTPANASPRATPVNSQPNGGPDRTKDVDSPSDPTAPIVSDDSQSDSNSDAVYHFSPGDLDTRGEGDPRAPGNRGSGGEGLGRGPNGPPTTTTTLASTAPPTTTSADPPTRTAPTSTTLPALDDDDESSDDDSMSKAIGSVSKPPAESHDDSTSPATTVPASDQPFVREAGGSSTPSMTAPTPVDEMEPAGPDAARNVVMRGEISSDWDFLMDEDTSAFAVVEPARAPKPEDSTSMVVLGWVVERNALGGPSMAILSPIVVLLTIWDAATSAGSGLAAPASGLGTFVLLVLFERGHLANGARLFRRRAEA